MLISLIAMGIVFLIWAVSMFQMLWAMWKIAARMSAERGGGIIKDTAHRWYAFWAFWRMPEYRQLKWRVIVLSIPLMAINIGHAYISLHMQRT